MKVAIGIAIALFMGLSAAVYATSEETAVMSVVNQYVDSFNKGDAKTALAACADETQIIDEFSPHVWHSCSQWATDYDADAKKNGITEAIVKLSKPRHVDITEDRAYVVVPANYSFKQNGKPMKEVGSQFTLVLQKGAAGWRITAWSWAKN